MTRTAILVDGGFYRREARLIWGNSSAPDRAQELYDYCLKHITSPREITVELGKRSLYRIFYYDCPPAERVSVWHPLKCQNVNFKASDEPHRWADQFHEELGKKRKVALRMGELVTDNAKYNLKPEVTKDLLAGKRALDQLTERDFFVDFKQGGVDMRIGLDIASLAYNGIVDQIILISGDVDFVPAAKTARRHGIDFLIDPMGQSIRPSLVAHTDGIETFVKGGG